MSSSAWWRRLLRGRGMSSGANQPTSAISPLGGSVGLPSAIEHLKRGGREPVFESVHADQMLDLYGETRLLARLTDGNVERTLTILDRAAGKAVAAAVVVLLDEEEAAGGVEYRGCGSFSGPGHRRAAATAAIGPGHDPIGSVERTM
jgi:hypothetical protein